MNSHDVSLLERMDELASIKMLTNKVVTGIFFSLAIISVIGRCVIRLRSHNRPTIDDYFVLFGTVCLVVATGIFHADFESTYLSQAVYLDPSIVLQAPAPKLIKVANTHMAYIGTELVFLWTATFAVKFSFLVFFWQLVQSVNKKILTYFWIVVGLTTVSWMFVVSEPFILCPYFGMESMTKCVFDRQKYFSLTGLVTALDAITDLMIVSIPILVLRQSKMKLRQKATIGSFLCLSLVMISTAIVRVSKMPGPNAIDTPYEIFWQYMEASIAILMASLTAYRTMFVLTKEKKLHQERLKRPSYSWRNWGRQKKPRDEEEDLPDIPRATLTGMRTFIKENNRGDSDDCGKGESIELSSGSSNGSFLTKAVI